MARPNKTDGILTPSQVAAELGCCDRTVQRLAAAGVLPAVPFGNRWAFRREDVDSYVATRTSRRQEKEAA